MECQPRSIGKTLQYAGDINSRLCMSKTMQMEEGRQNSRHLVTMGAESYVLYCFKSGRNDRSKNLGYWFCNGHRAAVILFAV